MVPKGAITRNVGENGLRIISNEFIPPATNLILEIFLPSLIGQIRALCKVIWAEKRRYSNQYDIGMEFIEITEEDKRYIAEFIEAFF